MWVDTLVQTRSCDGETVNPVSIVASINFELLTLLIYLDTFENVADIDTLDDDILEDWLKEQINESVSFPSKEYAETFVKASV